jgi:DNA-binding NarL/FixJ family response regulator
MLASDLDGPSATGMPIRVAVTMPADAVRDAVTAYLAGEACRQARPIVLVGVGTSDAVIPVDVDVGVVAASFLPTRPGGAGPMSERRKGVPRLVVLFSATDRQALDPAVLLRCGVRAMLDTATPISHVGRAIDAVATGAVWLEPALWHRLLGGGTVVPDEGRILATLTAKELETLRLVADGLSNAQIAAKQTVTVKTVKFHISNLLHKLGRARRAELVALAHRRGLASD